MKKLFSVLLVAVLLMSCMTVFASAAESATFSGNYVTTHAGETVTVTVSASKLTYQDYGMYASYNTGVLTLTSVSAGSASNGTFGYHDNGGSVKAAVYGGNETTTSGVLFTMTFQVAADAAPGKYPIDLSIISVRNEAQDYLDVVAVDGCVEIICEHNWEVAEVKQPTCTEAGYTKYVCSKCGGTKSDPIAATGHNYKGVVTAPTCTEKGYTTYTCSKCGDSYVGDYTNAAGHKYVGKVTKEADCVNAGVKTYTCSVCGDKYTESIPALGHKAAEAVKENIVGADCVTAGSYDLVVYCSVCGEKLSTEHVTGKPLGHTSVVVPGKAATCTETGLTEGAKCSVCGEVLVKQEVIPALGHKSVVVPAKAATCTETGLTEGAKCSVCGVVLVKQDVIPALGHKSVVVPGKAATCTETGLTEGAKCSVCGVVLVKQDVIPALGHDWDEGKVTKEATCTAEGEKTFTCKVCGVTKVEKIKKLDHDYTEYECSGKWGKHTIICSVCGDEFKDENCFDADKDGKCDACGCAKPVTPTTKPDDEDDDDVPKTGDITPYPVYFLIALMAVVATSYGLKRKFDV